MSKKLLFLISFALVLGLTSNASAIMKWWSDLDPCDHLWSSPDNWYFDPNDPNAPDSNEVPTIDDEVYIGKGEAHQDYPPYLYNLIVNQGHQMIDPIIDSNVTANAGLVRCSGGYDLDGSSPDPCLHHTLTMTGGTFTIGSPIYGDWYRWEDENQEFLGQWGFGVLAIGSLGNSIPGAGSGTMIMSGGIVNVGGHMEVGAWWYSDGLLDMTGGTINIIQGFYCPASLWNAYGHTNLHGGTINAGYLHMETRGGSTGSMDITEGIMILNGDESEIVTGYCDGGLITVYGVGSGEIDPCTGLRVALSLDYDASNDGKTTIQTFVTDPNQAWAPSPPNGAGNVRGTIANIARPVLSWSPGNGAVSHDVYFGTSFADVNSATTSSGVCKEIAYDPCSYTVDSDLQSSGTYYWRIDENPGPVKGQVWDFTMANLAKAGLPKPADGASDVNPIEDLSWGAGIYAVSHDVYFSTDFNDVNDRLISAVNTGTNNYYDPPGAGLEFSTTYYWRVDECNALGGPDWPGDLWSFTTSDHIDVDDFDSYGPDPALRAVWKDLWSGSLWGKNGAEIFLETSPDYVIDGNSMRYYFRNINTYQGNYVGSEAEASTVDLEVGTDWTASGPEALVLNFYGDATNLTDTGGVIDGIHQDQMYVALEDGDGNVGIVKYPDMNDIKEPWWQEWNIDLQDPCLADVNMANVAKVYIGFGGQKVGQTERGAGDDTLAGDTVWFDDIGLWPIRCVPAFTLATDFTDDCVVDRQDFDIMAGDWLITDYNTLGYAGTLRGFLPDDDPNGPHWISPGRIGDYALEFGVGHYREDPNENDHAEEGTGIDDDVLIPPLELNTNTVTFTCWAKRHGKQWDDSALFHIDGIHGEFIGDTVVGFTLSNGPVNLNGLGYNWNNDSETWTWVPKLIPKLPNNEWAFCALVIEPTQATIYIKIDSDPIPTLYSESISNSHAPEPFEIPAHIGSHKWRYFDGLMDDFRIYDYSLTSEQIKFLAFEGAQGTEPDPNIPFGWYKFDDGSGFVAEDSGGGGVVYHKVSSRANLVDPEVPYSRSVNFRDYVLLANDWLKESPWPPRP